MEAEAVLNLFDSYWFDLHLFKKIPSKDPYFPELPSSNPVIPTLPTIQTKSSSPVKKKFANFSPKSLSDSSASPNSVLLTPKLQTIFSGKISEDFEDSRSEKETQENTTTITTSKTNSPLKGNSVINRRRKKKGLSKSLSDLEFEELKGFIDLGFVFSEQDKDSNLASILPGLHRLGNTNTNTNHNHNNNDDIDSNYVDKSGASISRPYLSEAWDELERKRGEDCLMNWRVPVPDNQVQMKDYLRFWAHTVASTVK